MPGRTFRLVLVILAAGAAVYGIAALIVTPGERARALVSDLVAAAVAADVSGAVAFFSPDATLAFGSPNNPGLPFDEIRSRLEELDGRYRIERNSITSLESETESPGRVIVRLSCRTELVDGYGMMPNEWIIEVTRQGDGPFLITRVTWVSLAGRPPSREW